MQSEGNQECIASNDLAVWFLLDPMHGHDLQWYLKVFGDRYGCFPLIAASGLSVIDMKRRNFVA